MINIDIDKTEATQEEKKYLEALDGFQMSISMLMKSGKKNGVSVVIKDIKCNGAISYMENSSEGITRLVVSHSRKGKSFISDNKLE